MLQRLLCYISQSSATAEKALLVLSAWDVVLHIMPPTVYQAPHKIHVLVGDNPQFLTNLTMPLFTDDILWSLRFSSFAKDQLSYESVPEFLKLLVQDVQTLQLSSSGFLPLAFASRQAA